MFKHYDENNPVCHITKDLYLDLFSHLKRAAYACGYGDQQWAFCMSENIGLMFYANLIFWTRQQLFRQQHVAYSLFYSSPSVHQNSVEHRWLVLPQCQTFTAWVASLLNPLHYRCQLLQLAVCSLGTGSCRRSLQCSRILRGRSRPSTDWHVVWGIEWCPRRNHLCQILCQSVKGFLGGSIPKGAISYT